MNCIDDSIFDLLKIGPGPSSSHTIGPMRAGYDFLQRIGDLPPKVQQQADTVSVHLYGALSATGKGHGTDKAVLAGLLGYQPETCPPGLLSGLLETSPETHHIALAGHNVSISSSDIIFDTLECNFPFSNTLVIKLGAGQNILYEREYYSVGGGFLQWKGWQPSKRVRPPYQYATASQLRQILENEQIELHELVLRNEMHLTGMTETQVHQKLDALLKVMAESVARGLETQGVLPGSLGLHRKAHALHRQAAGMQNMAGRFTTLLCSYAFAASEENAAGQPIVTAPTCGSAGVIPAIAHAMAHHLGFSAKAIRRGLMAATVIGFLAKHNASIAGADVGCQGEVGVASAMAAAMLTYARTGDPKQTENAAESALEHHLGLTCDPVGGYVQIPCIERNAMAAVKAHAAYLIATTEMPSFHVVALDDAIAAMNETGRDISPKYRETSSGGLAIRVKC